MSQSNKYMNIIEIGFAAIGITLGTEVAPDNGQAPAPQTIVVNSPDKPEVIADPATGQNVTVNTQSNQNATNFVMMCTYASIGIGILGFKINDIVRDWRMKNADTPQEKLSACEEKMQDFIKARQEHDERMAKDMQMLRESNETLNRTIAAQIDTIAKLSSSSSPVVVTTSAPNSPLPPQSP